MNTDRVSTGYLGLLTRDEWTAIAPGHRMLKRYGGPHQALPSFLKYGIVAGDRVFYIGMDKGRARLFTRLVVARVLPIERHDIEVFGAPQPSRGCVTDVLVAADATPFDRNVVVPVEVLRALRFQPKRGPERGLKLTSLGGLVNPKTVAGHYNRLSAASAALLDEVLAARADAGYGAAVQSQPTTLAAHVVAASGSSFASRQTA